MTSRRTFLRDLLSTAARLCAALVSGGAVLSLAGCPKKYGGPPIGPVEAKYGGPPLPTSRPAAAAASRPASRPAAP